MIADVFWANAKFPGGLALVLRPRGGEWLEDEVQTWANAGLDIIVSMLESEEIHSFDLERESEFCSANGLEFFNLPVPDRGVPKLNGEFWGLIKRLGKSLSEGKNIGIHCRQSVGRAPLAAAVLMVLFGISPTEAFQQLSEVRGIEVPETAEQIAWVEDFSEQLAVTPF